MFRQAIFAAVCLCTAAYGGGHCYRPYYYAPVEAVQVQAYAVTSAYSAPFVSQSDLEGIENAQRKLNAHTAAMAELRNQSAAEALRQNLQLQQLIQSPPEGSPPLALSSSLDAQVADIFRANKCYNCHGSGKRPSVREDVASMTKLERCDVYFHTSSEEADMPKGAASPGLSAESLRIVRRWMKEVE